MDTLSTHQQSVERAITAMRERFDEDLSLSDIAAIGFMSPFHFNRVFHQMTGLPPRRFLSALRIHLAKRLLLTTKEQITDICFSVGYSSLGTFTRRFNELVGLPPSRFRLLGQSAIEEVLSAVHEMATPSAKHAIPELGIKGSVGTMASYRSVVLIGLFAEALAQGRPLACATALSADDYQLPPMPDGRYELLAVSLSLQEPIESLLYERALRARQPIRIEDGRAVGLTNLMLQPPRHTDPPILTALPWLLAQHMSQQPGAGKVLRRLLEGLEL